MINFEKQDEYRLDMPHFGLMKGIRTDEEIKNKVQIKILELQKHLQASFSFIKQSSERLMGWLEFSIEELPKLLTGE